MKSNKLFPAALVIIFVIINLSSKALPNTLTLGPSQYANLYNSNTYDSIDIMGGGANIYGGNFTIGLDDGWANIYGGNSMIGNFGGSLNIYGGVSGSHTDLGTTRIYGGINGLEIEHVGIVYMYGGEAQVIRTWHGGIGYIYGGMTDILDSVDEGRIFLYGGLVNSADIALLDFLTMYGGMINDLTVGNDSGLTMFNGRINNLNLEYGSAADIYGGIVSLNVEEAGHANIYGGIIENLTYPMGNYPYPGYPLIDLFGHDFQYIYNNGIPVRLEGYLSDGSPLNIALGDTTDLFYKIHLNNVEVPEPSTLLLIGSGLLGLAGYGRKKLFKK